MDQAVDIKELNERIQKESSFVDMVTMEMNKVIIGQKHLVESLLIGLLSLWLGVSAENVFSFGLGISLVLIGSGLVMRWIIYFDRAKPESPVYDEAAVPDFESFLSSFKGIKIVSEDPLSSTPTATRPRRRSER